jgi:UDP-N-acetylmuramyl pentapeptide synthase
MFDFLGNLLLICAPAVGCLFAAHSLIHYFQLESYQFPGFYHSVKRNLKRSVLPGAMLAVLYFALYIAAGNIMESGEGLALFLVAIVVFALSGLGGWWIGKLFQDKKAKKALIITARVKRLYVVLFVLCVLICIGIDALHIAYIPVVIPLLLPMWVALAGLLAWPIEKGISEYYFRDAKNKLMKMNGLIRIGITGSYGKTSVKFILGTILSEKYKTFVTPSSFNTPMGVSRAIREGLRQDHQVFVSEMGARHVGDIKEMCRLVKPQYGILSSVGPQHLETFKTIERVAQTKYELIEALPKDGFAVFPEDGGICTALYEKAAIKKALVSVKGKADIYADEIKATFEGSQFNMHARGNIHPCKTKLLGAHNIQNILLAAAMAFELGLTPMQIVAGISKIEPIAHRLQIVPSGNGMTVIDDAFNSNPIGASAALEVLKSFEARRVIITPGMVELGEKEADYNRAFGKQIAVCADIAIIIGKKRVLPLLEGLKDGGMESEGVFQVASLDESTVVLQKLMRAGDVILYENDLPDNYNEA